MAQQAAAELAQSHAGRCLNCGETLHGAFCAACGQRSVPADPTVAEVAGDAWQELTGYDGRIAATFRALLHPGRLTLEYLHGRRARYLSPMRLYLSVSVIFFLLAAAAPETAGGLHVGVVESDGRTELTEEERAQALEDLEASSSWVLRTFVRPMIDDPGAFRAQIFNVMPRVFFAMLPAFAGIVALFYRRRRFPAALVFAVHVHAFAFLIFSASQLAKFSNSTTVTGVVAAIVASLFTVYALRAFRSVFGGSWPATIAKAMMIGFLYLLISVPAFLIMLIWAVVV